MRIETLERIEKVSRVVKSILFGMAVTLILIAVTNAALLYEGLKR